jgi:hypothetical protein
MDCICIKDALDWALVTPRRDEYSKVYQLKLVSDVVCYVKGVVQSFPSSVNMFWCASLMLLGHVLEVAVIAPDICAVSGLQDESPII